MSEERKRNLPTEAGREIGNILAKLTDVEIKRKNVPDTRCDGCAFRKDTGPNGCEQTIMDAVMCAVTKTPFHCHKKEGHPVCAGYEVMQFPEPAPPTTATKLWMDAHLLQALNPE